MATIRPDERTAHESAADEAHVGRFSVGLEARPATHDKLHRGRFSAGVEVLPESDRKRRLGRFSDGLAGPARSAALRRGSFADRDAGLRHGRG